MIAILDDDNNIILQFSYDPRIVAFVRTLPRRKYNAASRTWTIPLTDTASVVPKLESMGFQVDPRINDAIKSDISLAKELQRLSAQPDVEFESDLPLFPYQRVGAKFMATAESAILGDEPGLGKTLQTIAVVQGMTRVLIFCPAILKYQWEAEIKKFLPSARTQVIDGTPADREKQWQDKQPTYFIANYELLLRSGDFFHMTNKHWDYIVADEATKISNHRAKQTKTLKRLRSSRRLALTGTPFNNRLEDIWSIVDFVQPGLLGSFFQFTERYCLKDYWGSVSGYKNVPELQAILARVMLRRTKEQVLPELPEKIVSDVPFELSAEERKLYEQIRAELLFEITKTDIDKVENVVSIQHTLVKMIRLRQLVDSMELLGQSTTSSKMEALKEILNDLSRRKIIIFTEFSQMADILERELKALKITGEISGPKREEILEAFRRSDNNLLILTSAGQWGLNIQAASVVIHYDQPWSMSKLTQREGRAHRLGQKQSVLVYNLLARKTVDEHVAKILKKKSAMSEMMFTMQDIKEILE